MHVQVFTGYRTKIERELLGRFLKELEEHLGDDSKPVYAEAYGAEGLVEILEVRAVNEREILVLSCSREQIQAVLKWQSETDEVIELEDLVLHLVKRVQSPEKTAGGSW
ncbi:hypothetical protein [Pseudomonas sp. ES3]|uniref:hypothetical protein n=1 Tax=Pseudomonas sp. ES3 TaxID=3424776 RepID=UPI003D3283E7